MTARLFDPAGPFRFDADPTGTKHRRDLFAARGDAAKRPSVDELLPRVVAALDGRGWVSAARLSTELGADARALREAANRSSGTILGGNRGYALTRQVPLEEVTAVINRHLSQSRQMRQRAMEIERVVHSLGGAA
jgi:hypothetical protein